MNKHPLADCEHCPLVNERLVPSASPQGATLAVVGEAPGYQETVYGQPFVGPSGKLIKELLGNAGVVWESTFRTNVVLCRPPNNEDPSPEAITACKPRLLAEIDASGCDTVLATGGFAAKAFTGSGDGILKQRIGPPKRSIHNSGLRVVPTVHPAYVLRSSDAFPFLVTDIQKIREQVRTFQEPEYVVPNSANEANALLEIFVPGRPLAVDIETRVDKETAYEHASQYDLLCIGLSNGAHTVILPGEYLQDRAVGFRLGTTLSNSRIIAQNGKFDIPALWRFAPNLRLWFDTLLASYALDERTSGIHSLDYMGQEHLGAPNWKADIKQYTKGSGDYGRIPRDTLHRYNAFDVACTYQLYVLLRERLRARNLLHLHDFLVRASNALMRMEDEGVAIDTAHLAELGRDFSARLSAQETRLSQWVANPRSWQQVQAALNSLGVGTPSTDVSHLQQIRARMDEYISAGRAVTKAQVVCEFIDALLDYRHWHRLHSTYVEGTRKRLYNGRIHTSYKLHGTVTGRLSSANPNVQNIPREGGLRPLYVASNGNIFLEVDFAQGELRIITLLAGVDRWTEAFRQGRSPLRELAAELFGASYTLQQYTRTKNIVYGTSYGMVLGRGDQGVKYARNELKMSNDEAYRYQQRYFALVPEVPLWQEKTRAFVKGGGTLTTYKGRSRHFWHISKENEKDILNEALAFVPQSTLSDICLTGTCLLVERGYHPRITVHDSVVVECRTDDVEPTQAAITAAMREAAEEFTTDIPMPVEYKISKVWGKKDNDAD